MRFHIDCSGFTWIQGSRVAETSKSSLRQRSYVALGLCISALVASGIMNPQKSIKMKKHLGTTTKRKPAPRRMLVSTFYLFQHVVPFSPSLYQWTRFGRFYPQLGTGLNKPLILLLNGFHERLKARVDRNVICACRLCVKVNQPLLQVDVAGTVNT